MKDKALKEFQTIESLLKQNKYSDSRPDFEKVWKEWRQTKGKEVQMAEKKGGVKIFAWLTSFLVVVALGWFGLTKLASIQKLEKIDKGENIVVTLVVGDVSVKKMGSTAWRELDVDDVIAMGDAIKTAADSYCEIQMIGRGIFRLESDTELAIAKLVNVNGDIKSRMKLNKGEVALKPKKLKKGEVFEVETETAVAAVRGTKFSVTADASGNTKVAVAEGKVMVSPNLKAIKQAEKQGLIDAKASKILKEQLIKPVAVTSDQELEMNSKKVETIDNAIAKGIEEVTKTEGPITAEKLGVKEEIPAQQTNAQEQKSEETPAPVTTPKPKIANMIIAHAKKEIKADAKENGTVDITKGDSMNLVAAVSKKQAISEDAKVKLEQISEDKIIKSVDEMSKLQMKSNPAGAEILINGEIAGVTPLDKIYKKGTELKIEIRKDGFEPFSQTVKLDNKVVNVTPNLKQIETAKAEEPKTEETNTVENKTEEVKEPVKVTGDELWKKSVNFVTVSDLKNPVVYRGKIYATKLNKFYIISLEGKILKKVTVSGANNLTRPVANAGKIYVGADTGGVWAYTTTGRLVWKSAKDCKQLYGASPMASKGIVAVPSSGNIIKIFSSGGKLLQTVKTGSAIYSTPLIGNGGKLLVYGTESGKLVGYNLEAKKEAWSKNLNSRIVYPLAGTSKTVAVLIRNSGTLYGFDLKTGEEKWKKTREDWVKTKVNPQSIGGMVVLVNRSASAAYAVYIENGGIVAKINREGISSLPYISGKWMYVGTKSGQIYGYNFSNKKTFTYSTGSPVVIVAADDKGVYGLSSSKMVMLVK